MGFMDGEIIMKGWSHTDLLRCSKLLMTNCEVRIVCKIGKL